MTLLNLLFLFLLFSTLALAQAPRPRTAPAPCTHWASPSGSGPACAEGSPCTIATFLTSQAQPGRVLCLRDGVYTGDQGMINVPESFAGTAEQPITIRAVNPGKVTIDGQDYLRPLNTKGRYGILSGLNAANGDNENVMIRGDHWLLKDLMTWNVGSNGDTNIHMSGHDNTVEDCGSWGMARKSIAAGAAGGERNTVRRCWARWEGNEHQTSNPSNTFEMGYGQNTVIFENTIATWDTKGRVTEPEGLGELFSTQGSKWLGSIFYLPQTASFPHDVLFFGTTDAGSHAQQGHFNPTSNLLFKHILAFIHPSHARFGSVRGFRWAEGTDTGHPPGTGNTLSDLLSIAGNPDAFSSSFPATRTQYGRSMAEAIGTGKSVWSDAHVSPGICKRYVAGQLTQQGLWPWPGDKRLSDALVQSGHPALSVTATMEALLGPIPAACRTTGTEPGPQPPSLVPVPPTNVTATMQGPGVLLSWQDTLNTVQTGYTVERKSGPQGYVQISEAPGPQARSFVDTAPVVGTENCYVVYARGAAGPSGFSEPACVQVTTTPLPPTPGTTPTPLTCVGTMSAGGSVAVACVPEPQEGRR